MGRVGRARNLAPAAVSTTALVVRASRRAPKPASRSAMMREAWDCEKPPSVGRDAAEPGDAEQ